VTIRNLTPHTVTLLVGDRRVDMLASGILPRVVEQEAAAPPVTVSGVEVPVVEVRLGTVQGLPERAAGVFLVVPRAVAQAHPHRDDLLIPYRLVRDSGGAVVGCAAFARVMAGS
jgi:hypothetical protein